MSGVASPTADLPARMAEVIVREVHPAQVVLFGSRARGTQTADSDVDLLVIDPDVPERQEALRRIRLALKNFMVPVDILVYSGDEVQRWRDSINHVIGHCLREGRVLYERKPLH